MSEHEKPKDVFSLLAGFHHTLHGAMSDKHGSPKLTAFVRVTVLLLGLGLAGAILWHSLLTMPKALAALISSATAFRVIRWYWRRGR